MSVIQTSRRAPVTLLHDQVTLGTTTTLSSVSVDTGAFGHFTLYLRLLSAGTPTDLRIIVEFQNPSTGIWHIYKQSLFAALYYEDEDLATEQDEVLNGDCAGRAMRVRLVATGTTAANTFTVSASAEFWA